MLIALSLVISPMASAWAAAPGNAETHGQGTGGVKHLGAGHAAMSDMAGTEMSDCMKAMGGDGADTSKSDCTCCDTQNKCPDTANCMTKCCKVIGALKPAGKMIPLSTVAYRQAEPAKPPEWLRTPPAPPPRT